MNNINDKCHTKYPIVLIHGTGFRDRKHLNYWGRIPKALMNNNCEVFYGNQESWATIENNAIIIKNSINKIMTEHGVEKVNLIAHSKGGLEARYIISSLDMSTKIASLTTMATPHHGSITMDKISKLPKVLFKGVSVFANLWFRILGDVNPDFQNVCGQFTTEFAQEFNNENPDVLDVYYQSYAAVMKNSFSDMFMFIPHFIINIVEGKNDGLVTPKSAKWTNFKGVFRGTTNRGISHADEVDIRRMRFSSKNLADGVNDICDVYSQIVCELKYLGY
jgi:triacylglycerol lipase